MRKLALVAPVVVALAGGLVSCTKRQEPAPPAPPPPPPPPARTDATAAAAPADAAPVKAGTATVKGTVKLAGKPPEMRSLNRAGDPFCARTPMKDEEVLVGPDGALANVLVRITKGLSGNYEAPMTNATLDQNQCMYRPRVQGMMAGQSLLITNSDQTLHNVHGYKGPSTLFNQAEIPGLPPIAKKFNTSGDILKFKCDVHPWMTAYVAVQSNPFFAVTGADGTFSIPKVPAGKYTIEAWHERYGTKTSEITVEAGAPAEVSFQDAAP
jgi:plastocyanin